MVFSTKVTWCAIAIALAFPNGWNVILKQLVHLNQPCLLRIGPYCLRCYLSVCYCCFQSFKCLILGHASNRFRDPFNYRFTLRFPGLLLQFSSHFLYFNSWAKQDRSLLNSDKDISLVDGLYVEKIEAIKSHTTLSASIPELISILGDTKFETRLWNSVNL
jgi:hypothetical protein